MQPLIESGHLYIAQLPLYRVGHRNRVHYAYTEEEKDKIIRDIGERASLSRYKGLG